MRTTPSSCHSQLVLSPGHLPCSAISRESLVHFRSEDLELVENSVTILKTEGVREIWIEGKEGKKQS